MKEIGWKCNIPISRRSIELLKHDFLHHIRQFPDFLWCPHTLDHIQFNERHSGSRKIDDRFKFSEKYIMKLLDIISGLHTVTKREV